MPAQTVVKDSIRRVTLRDTNVLVIKQVISRTVNKNEDIYQVVDSNAAGLVVLSDFSTMIRAGFTN